ncbi:response regulator transcription factor [Chloroflexota bacterium]
MNDENEENDTILVIDDEPDLLSLVERILEPEGFNVLTAVNGKYGLNLVQQTDPDLILLDIMMSGPSGLAILPEIRKSSNAPVIIITGRRDTESMEQAFSSGADDYIMKPFRSAELVARIKSKLRRI